MQVALYLGADTWHVMVWDESGRPIRPVRGIGQCERARAVGSGRGR